MTTRHSLKLGHLFEHPLEHGLLSQEPVPPFLTISHGDSLSQPPDLFKRAHLRTPSLFFVFNFHVITVRNVVVARLCFHRHLSFCSQRAVGWCVSQHALGQTTPPWADTPHSADTTPLSRHPPLGRYHPPPPTTADGTHPTGTHSCLIF